MLPIILRRSTVPGRTSCWRKSSTSVAVMRGHCLSAPSVISRFAPSRILPGRPREISRNLSTGTPQNPRCNPFFLTYETALYIGRDTYRGFGYGGLAGHRRCPADRSNWSGYYAHICTDLRRRRGRLGPSLRTSGTSNCNIARGRSTTRCHRFHGR